MEAPQIDPATGLNLNQTLYDFILEEDLRRERGWSVLLDPPLC